jgi:PPOX class probable F420-dependent enzyme
MELAADVRALFEAPNYAHLATVLPGGGPHAVPVWAGLEDRKIAFLTSPDSRKARNLAADPRVAISVTDRANPYVMAWCAAALPPGWTASRAGTSSTGSRSSTPASPIRCGPAGSCS